jgi:hypothetical protein
MDSITVSDDVGQGERAPTRRYAQPLLRIGDLEEHAQMNRSCA